MEVYESRYTANGIGLNVARWGTDHDQPPLLLVHGIWDSWRTFLPIAPALGARRIVYAVDLRGHGASDKPADEYSYDHYADDIAALLPLLSNTRIGLLGFSLGGLVAARLVARGASPVSRLILEDPPLPAARRARELIESYKALLALKRQPLEEIVEEFSYLYPTRTREAHRASAQALVNTADGPLRMFTDTPGARITLVADLERVRVPVLIAHADPALGGAIPEESVAALRTIRPEARIVQFPGAGHAIHGDQPEAFVAAIEEFLSRPD